MTNSRVNKYKELREGLKDEAGINREATVNTIEEDEEDEFLSFVNRGSSVKTEPVQVEDTLVEAKTFEQIRKESSKEIEDALKSVKSNMGREEQYNTRMDILNKIRTPEKENVHIDKVEDMKTEQFAQGVFVNKVEEEPEVIEEPKQPKRKVTLMERLSAMSPKEDVERVEKALRVESVEEKETPDLEMEETSSLEEMLKLIKKKDRMEVEKVRQNTEPIQPIVKKEKRITNAEKENRVSRVEKEKEAKENKVVDVLNYIIVALIVVFIVLCVMIIKQIFF